MGDIAEPYLEALTRRAKSALEHWDLADQNPELLKYRENAVFKIRLNDGQPAVLRLHRPGYTSGAALSSELQWVKTLKRGGIEVPEPIPTSGGREYVTMTAGEGFPEQNADIVSWLAGRPLGVSGVPLDYGDEELTRIFTLVGRTMARLHNVTDGWNRAQTFERPSWDVEGLLGERPLWGRFWDLDPLSADDRRKLESLRQTLRAELQCIGPHQLDFGLVHGDLVRENILVTPRSVQFIDFDDSGFGWRLFDIATTLLRNRREPRYPAIKNALLTGYRQARELSDVSESFLPLFLLLRSLTYVGWIGERPEISDSAERLARYLKDVYELADAFHSRGSCR